jgi:hypothetical protein
VTAAERENLKTFIFAETDMDEETFWRLIESSKAETKPELSNQPEILRGMLETLPPEEIAQFGRMFRLCTARHIFGISGQRHTSLKAVAAMMDSQTSALV